MQDIIVIGQLCDLILNELYGRVVRTFIHNTVYDLNHMNRMNDTQNSKGCCLFHKRLFPVQLEIHNRHEAKDRVVLGIVSFDTRSNSCLAAQTNISGRP